MADKKVKVVGTIPANCRCDVLYGKDGKPKVKFSYTSKSPHKDALSQNYLGPIFLFLLMAWAVFLAGYYLVNYIDGKSEPSFCNVYSDEYHWFNPNNFSQRTDIVYGYNFTCNNGNYYIEWQRGSEPGTLPGFTMNQIKNVGGSQWYYMWVMTKPLRWIGGSLIVLILVNMVLVRIFIKMKWYQHWIPRWNAKGNLNKKYWKFRKEEVDNNMVEIPRFGNVMLEYKTHGDFSTQLERIKIREHQWYKYNYKKKKTYGKKKVDAYKWYARFYFKQKPKDGWLEVIYR